MPLDFSGEKAHCLNLTNTRAVSSWCVGPSGLMTSHGTRRGSLVISSRKFLKPCLMLVYLTCRILCFHGPPTGKDEVCQPVPKAAFAAAGH